MRADKVFVDANVLVYAYDISAGSKHQSARECIEQLWKSESGVLSVQVLQEFFVTTTQKIKNPLDVKIAEQIIRDLMQWEVMINNGLLLLDAIAFQQKHRYSFWDSLIIQAAISADATTLLSEDMQHGQKIGAMKIINPFINTH